MTRRHFALTIAAGTITKATETLVWTPDSTHWQPIDKDGAKYAVLDGDRDRRGDPFTYASWMPGGVWVGAHHHTQQAHVAVVKGTMLLGFGRKLDNQKPTPVKAGEPHFEGSNGECLITGAALGGWKTTMLE